jgi:hypothetical protein
MTTTYDTPIDKVTETVLRGDAVWEVKRLMTEFTPEDLTACELIAVLTVLRGMKERLDAQQRTAAPVLHLMGNRRPEADGCRRRSVRE